MRTPLFTFVMIAICFVSGTIAAAQEKWPCIRVGEGEAEARIYAALETPVDMNFQEAPLQDVIGALAAKAQVPVILDEKALTEAGVSTDTPVSIQVKQVSFKAALRIMLGNLDLTYVVRDEVLQITTPDFANRKRTTCLFNVAEIARTPEEIEKLNKIIEQTFSHGEPDKLTPPSRRESEKSIPPVVFGKVLIIVGNTYEQEEVAEFLAALHKSQGAGAETPKTP